MKCRCGEGRGRSRVSAGVGLAAAVTDAEEFVRRTTEQLVAEIKPKARQFETEPAAVYSVVERVMSEHIDLERMARWILGKHWARATPAQRDAFLAEFKKILIRTYSRPFVDYLVRPLSFLPARPRSEDDVAVPIQVSMTAGQTVSVQFDMHPQASTWKIHDVSVDGVSLVASYRTSYTALANKSGMDGLLEKMRELNARFDA